MAHKYLADFTDEEQGYLHDDIRKGKTTARRVARAHVFPTPPLASPMRKLPRLSTRASPVSIVSASVSSTRA